MASWEINMNLPRRAAMAKVGQYAATKLGIEQGMHSCHVLGLFQEADGDSACPVFVCEFENGMVYNCMTEDVQFVSGGDC